jgi:thiosulfate/3-mercaptopyruvate sulfurtransferase
MKKNIISTVFTLSVLMLLLSCVTSPGLKEYPTEFLVERIVSDKSLLVETGWLARKGNSSKLRIIDYGRKLQDYETGHIAGAVFVDRKTVWDKVNGIPGMLPSVETVVAELEKARIDNDSTVVIYDRIGGLWASRLFWALEYLGLKDVHILNGGWNKWFKERRPIQMGASIVPRGNLTVHLQPDLLSTKKWILDNLTNPGVQIIDTRSFMEYIGADVRAARGGHIPRAVNINWIFNLTSNDSKTFLPEKELTKLYESMEISKNKTIATYCQTGIRAAHTYFVFRLLGYPKVRVYDASWAEWGRDFGTPVITKSISSPK